MLGTEAGDPTACAGPRARAGNLGNVDVAVFLKMVVEPFEPSEKFTFPAFSTSRRFGLGIAVRRDESHSYGFCCCDLFVRQLALTIFFSKAGNPQSDSPSEPFFMSFGVRVAVLPGIGRQTCQSSVEVDSASAHGWSITTVRCLRMLFRRVGECRIRDGTVVANLVSCDQKRFTPIVAVELHYADGRIRT